MQGLDQEMFKLASNEIIIKNEEGILNIINKDTEIGEDDVQKFLEEENKLQLKADMKRVIASQGIIVKGDITDLVMLKERALGSIDG